MHYQEQQQNSRQHAQAVLEKSLRFTSDVVLFTLTQRFDLSAGDMLELLSVYVFL